MSIPAYVDTNIFMDFFLKRDPRAYVFLRAAIACKYTILMSDLTVHELSKHNLLTEAENIARVLEKCKKLVFCTTTDEDKKAARAGTTHYADALHTVLANRHGAKVIVTQNVKDFHDSDIKIITLDNF